MQPFEIVRPRAFEEAFAALADPGSRAIAGGTGLVDLMKLGVERPRRVVDISRLPLAEFHIDSDGLRIGALVSNSAVAADMAVRRNAPAISEAVLSGASGQIRNAATVGGNLMQATRCPYFRGSAWPCNRKQPGSGCAALGHEEASHAVLGRSAQCIAVHPSDLVVALLALDATVHLRGAGGYRSLSIAGFYRQPGNTPHVLSALGAGELITAVHVPLSSLSRNSTYLKLRHRASFEFAAASVGAALHIADGRIADIAVALGGVGTVPWRRRDLERELIGHRPTEALFRDFGNALLEGATGTDATMFKVPLARGAISRALQDLTHR